jgi:hypothetical protein
MRNLVLLIRFYFSTFYALPAIKDSQGKISAKSILKLAGIIVLALYMLSTFGFLAWQIYGSLYKVFASVGIERLILVYALIYGSLYVLIIGFISSFSSVYTNEMEAYMATLPIKSVYLLSGKAAALSVTDFMIALLIILLLPIVLGISLYFSVGNQASIQEISNAARKLITPVQQVLISIITGAFLGSATSITCTALSRDAKQLGYLKTLPVSPRLFLGAKLLHGSIFGFVGAIVAVGISSFLFQVDEPLLLLVLGASSVLSVLFNLLGLYIDTLNPALNWENPVAAMKQNINAVVMMLLEMLIFAGIGVGSFMWIHSMALLIIFLLALPLVLTLILLAVYFPLGEARLRRLEV